MTTITIQSDDKEQLNVLKAVLKALKMKFEVSHEKTYNAEFIAKIDKSRKEIQEGKGTILRMEELNSLFDNN
jgi:hypothetical protein